MIIKTPSGKEITWNQIDSWKEIANKIDEDGWSVYIPNKTKCLVINRKPIARIRENNSVELMIAGRWKKITVLFNKSETDIERYLKLISFL